MFKHFLIVFFCTTFSNNSFCQESGNYRKDSIDIRNISEMQIVLDSSEQFPANIQLPFKSIKIEDVRFDTTQVGIYTRATSDFFVPVLKNYKINFKGGLSNSLETYLNNSFKKFVSNDSVELVCFIKELNLNKTDTFTENTYSQRTYGNVRFHTEVFLRRGDNFYAVFKIDTVLNENISIKKTEIIDEVKDYLLNPLLKLLQNKISSITWEKIIKKKSFSESVVYENYFSRRFALPIFTQAYKKGIYKTFAEFKYNAPSIIDFKVEKGKFKTTSLIDKNGNYLPPINMFGFCDGERCWILRGNYCFPLMRTGNSFEFFLTLHNNLKVLLAIDMEKGNIY